MWVVRIAPLLMIPSAPHTNNGMGPLMASLTMDMHHSPSSGVNGMGTGSLLWQQLYHVFGSDLYHAMHQFSQEFNQLGLLETEVALYASSLLAANGMVLLDFQDLFVIKKIFTLQALLNLRCIALRVISVCDMV